MEKDIKLTKEQLQQIEAYLNNNDIEYIDLHLEVLEYTAAPKFTGTNGKGCHEWILEFKNAPKDLQKFRYSFDQALKNLNSDYEAKRREVAQATRQAYLGFNNGLAQVKHAGTCKQGMKTCMFS